jgi:hypothetical protein
MTISGVHHSQINKAININSAHPKIDGAPGADRLSHIKLGAIQ